MNIRKILNLPNKLQKTKIQNDIDMILNKCDIIAQNEINEQQENKELHDNTCSICKTKTIIVNKFISISNIENVNNNIKFGFGKIKSSIITNIEEVNHCNTCGNEWKKYKTKPISKTNILNLAFKYLKEIIKNKENKRDWKLETIQVFDDCYAEALYKLNIWKRTDIKLSTLRKYYKSIYDKIENNNLEKI